MRGLQWNILQNHQAFIYPYTSDVALKFGLDIQSQTKVRKLKNPSWSPGGYFENGIAENQQASAHGHKKHAYKI